MPNWCSNIITVEGPEDQRKDFFNMFIEMRSIENETGQGVMPIGMKPVHGTHTWFFSIGVEGDVVYAETKWNPLEYSNRYMSEKFPDLEITVDYSEPNMELHGILVYKNGELMKYKTLEEDEFDLQPDDSFGWVKPSGEGVDTDSEYYDSKLENKEWEWMK